MALERRRFYLLVVSCEQFGLAKGLYRFDDIDHREVAPFNQNPHHLSMRRTRQRNLFGHLPVRINEGLHNAPALVEGLHEVFIVMQRTDEPTDVSGRASMAEALANALASGKQVIATHDDNSAEITVLQVLN